MNSPLKIQPRILRAMNFQDKPVTLQESQFSDPILPLGIFEIEFFDLIDPPPQRQCFLVLRMKKQQRQKDQCTNGNYGP